MSTPAQIQAPGADSKSIGRKWIVPAGLVFLATLIAIGVLPRLERNIRPATRSVFKTGIALYERGREKAAEIGEAAGDLMAEARAEYESEQQSADAAAGAAAENDVARLRRGNGREAGSPNA